MTNIEEQVIHASRGLRKDAGGRLPDLPSHAHPSRPESAPHLRSIRHAGFSLIELLVVVGVIAILASLILGALGVVRRAALIAVCQNNLKQMAMAFEAYLQDSDGLFPKTGLWASTILPDSPDPLYSRTKKSTRRCPSTDGRKDQFASWAGIPAQSYGMNARLAPDYGSQSANAAAQKPSARLSHRSQAAVIMETMQSEQWGGADLIGFGSWYSRANDTGRHKGSSNILFADWHVELRRKQAIPTTRSSGNAEQWAYWTGSAPP